MATTQDYYKTALMLAGMPEEEASKSVADIKAARSIDWNCPRCGSLMQSVKLLRGRRALYCTVDRVAIPVQFTS